MWQNPFFSLKIEMVEGYSGYFAHNFYVKCGCRDPWFSFLLPFLLCHKPSSFLLPFYFCKTATDAFAHAAVAQPNAAVKQPTPGSVFPRLFPVFVPLSFHIFPVFLPHCFPTVFIFHLCSVFFLMFLFFLFLFLSVLIISLRPLSVWSYLFNFTLNVVTVLFMYFVQK